MRRRIRRKLFLVAAALIVTLIFLLQLPAFWRPFYPFPYRDLITAEAERNGLDPYLVAAVIKTESNFNPRARSDQGAVGLMQVMPDTARWAAGQMQWRDFSPEMLEQPEVNIKIGTWYLAELKREFSGDIILALAAYNGGRGNVREWLKTNRWSGERTTLDQIPFPETREFVKKVLRNYQRYRWIYGKK